MLQFLFLLFAFVVGRGESSRSAGPTALDESRLTPAERDELRRIEHSRALALQAANDGNTKLSRLTAQLEEARGEIRRGFILVLLWAIGFVVFSYFAYIQSSGFGRIFNVVILAAVWISYFIASVMFMKGKYAEQDEVLARMGTCRTGIVAAENRAQEGIRMIDNARNRLHSLVRGRERAREEEQAQLVRAQAELAAAQTMQALFTARQEAERREREAALARAAESQRGELGAFLKSALAHWKLVAKRPDAFVAIHADRIVADEERIMAAYSDPSMPGFTADDCLRLAADARREYPGEVAFGLRNPADRTVEKLAYILRRYVGDAREVLLPKAQKLVYERDRMRSGSPAPASIAPRTTKLIASQGPLADLPPEDQQSIVDLLKDIRTMEALDATLDEEYTRYEARLRRRIPPLGEAEIARALEKHAGNLAKLKEDWAATKGFAV